MWQFNSLFPSFIIHYQLIWQTKALRNYDVMDNWLQPLKRLDLLLQLVCQPLSLLSKSFHTLGRYGHAGRPQPWSTGCKHFVQWYFPQKRTDEMHENLYIWRPVDYLLMALTWELNYAWPWLDVKQCPTPWSFGKTSPCPTKEGIGYCQTSMVRA